MVYKFFNNKELFPIYIVTFTAYPPNSTYAICSSAIILENPSSYQTMNNWDQVRRCNDPIEGCQRHISY